MQVTTATRMLTVLMLATHSRVHVEQATQEMEFSAMVRLISFEETNFHAFYGYQAKLAKIYTCKIFFD